MKRTNLHLPQQQLDALDALAKKLGICRAELIRKAVQDFLDKR